MPPDFRGDWPKTGAQAGAMFPGQVWRTLVKPLVLLCCASILLGFALLGLEVKPAAYFFFALSGLLFLIYLLSSFIECRVQPAETETTGASSSARNNEAFEVPSYEEAVVSAQGPNLDLGEPPPYSTVIPSQLQEEVPNHLEGHAGAGTDMQGRSEGTMTQPEDSLDTPINLQLQGSGSEALPEPLTPPPEYEFGHSNHDINDDNDDNVVNDDSVFYEEGRTPP